jgi:glycosyltransferase involved in cell wall biosynthesis
LVAFPSDFEGFGLPIVEGMALGKPVVIGPDAGCLEVAGGHAAVMKDWTHDGLANAIEAALVQSPSQSEDARAWADTFTWRRTIVTTRDALAALAARPDEPTPSQNRNGVR